MRYAITTGLLILAAVGRLSADTAAPGRPWERPGSTVQKAILCDGLDDAGQPRHPGQVFDAHQRVVVLWLAVDPAGNETAYDVVWSRAGKSILERSWTVRWARRRLFTLAPTSTARLAPGQYQVEVREDKLAVRRISFVIGDAQ